MNRTLSLKYTSKISSALNKYLPDTSDTKASEFLLEVQAKINMDNMRRILTFISS
jgi:hypothetical protein